MTIEINNILSERLLPNELFRQVFQKSVPQFALFFCHCLAQISRITYQFVFVMNHRKPLRPLRATSPKRGSKLAPRLPLGKRTDPLGSPRRGAVERSETEGFGTLSPLRGTSTKREASCPLGSPERGSKLALPYFLSLFVFKISIKTSLGTSTVPIWRMRFLPSFCFSRSFFLRVMSPP